MAEARQHALPPAPKFINNLGTDGTCPGWPMQVVGDRSGGGAGLPGICGGSLLVPLHLSLAALAEVGGPKVGLQAPAQPHRSEPTAGHSP